MSTEYMPPENPIPRYEYIPRVRGGYISGKGAMKNEMMGPVFKKGGPGGMKTIFATTSSIEIGSCFVFAVFEFSVF